MTNIDRLRDIMQSEGLDAYIALTSDEHMSESICAHYKSVEYLCGFTGSNATLIVTLDEAALFTDSRYFLQAERELVGAKLMRTDEEADIIGYLKACEPRVIGVDGKTIAATRALNLINALPMARLDHETLVTDKLWHDRPVLPSAFVYALKDEYSGKSAAQKLSELRALMDVEGAGAHVLTSLDDIAWLFNLRGRDMDYTPMALAYALICMDSATLFIDEGKLQEGVKERLDALGVQIAPYEEVYDIAKCRNCGGRVLISRDSVNYTLYRMLSEGAEILDRANPTSIAKSIKNPVECENLRRTHVKDGAAVTELLYLLKTRDSIKDISDITETDVARMADNIRAKQEGFICPSFATIAGYKENAAVVHYQPRRGADARLYKEGLLLIDSGGQYMGGTTDITRTIALGPVSETQKLHYTLVLKGLLAFSGCMFPKGCRANRLDVLARAPLWNAGLDYAHGTGHGIGYMLGVHEPPVNVRWNSKRSVELEAGMVLSVEPGVYMEGSHGVRLENQISVTNAADDHLCFETLTLVPFDLDAIDMALLCENERDAINAYHARVKRELSPYIGEKERLWLEWATREI